MKQRQAAEPLTELRRRADQGDAEAQFNLGFMYDNGEGVPQDDQEAVKWYRMAAEQGYAGAQFALGLMYDNDQGVPENDAEVNRELVAQGRRAGRR